MAPIDILPVRTPREKQAFIALPWDIYRNDSSWVPPLLMDVKARLEVSPLKNPFFAHAEAQLWLAKRGDEVVGRISAHIDEDYNAFHEEKTGWFGWYESVDDLDVMKALIETAAGWLKDRGMDQMLGPGCWGTNDSDLGFLVDSYDIPPMIMNGHSAPYYPGLIEKLGFEKAMNLLCYRLDNAAETPAHIRQFAEHIEKRPNLEFRTINMREEKKELEAFLEIYNAAWEKNWGFVPMRDEEFYHHAKDLKLIIWPDFAMFAYIDGKPAGAALSLPNINEILIGLNGRLLPMGWRKLLKGRHKVSSIRVFTLGVKKEYRAEGLGALFYHKTLEAGKKHGIRWGEMSWILENNVAMNKAIVAMGGEVYKTYRLYQKAL